ncbi:Glyoxylase, beta-lactamase superfamily II [Arthrobacter alpinus]|uniref:Glyoxylase, beta-lactamase superfamily II n=1 Tax=Arthrobacter alpinus TaxID=656366 RepID=A0A1H5NBB8_9MICC|nr:MBL fold metallo-hydrolase [Arthrobacter alpinus]SEE98855.1 Glyoxylase, beta-lactamase superfamily II [Arthrobacter alpinus]
MPQTWQELGGGCFVLPGNEARVLVNTGLVVGAQRALVIDTGCGPRHAAEILAAVRTVTTLPLVGVNTHAHWDHFFGNATFKEAGLTELWAHKAAAQTMADTGESQRRFVAGAEPDMAAATGPGTEIVLPAHHVGAETVVLDLGGVEVELFTLGPGHSSGDLMVGAPGVLFAGDVLEVGAAPDYEDAFPSEWAAVLRRLAGMGEKYPVMVPGHGRPVDAGFAAHMAEVVAAAP